MVKLKKYKVNIAARTRVMDINSDSIQKIPPANNHSQLWYDKELPYFAVRRYKESLEFCLIPTEPMQRLSLLIGMDLGRRVIINETDVGKARKIAKEKWEDINKQLAAAAKSYERKPIENPEDILKDREPNPNPSYDVLMSVLMDAYDQAVNGKGADRHNAGKLSFEDQDMLAVMDLSGIDFALGQAIKKIVEGRRLSSVLARREYLGAIVYLAGAIVWADRK